MAQLIYFDVALIKIISTDYTGTSHLNRHTSDFYGDNVHKKIFQGKFCPAGASLGKNVRKEADVLYEVDLDGECDRTITARCLSPLQEEDCKKCQYNRGHFVGLASNYKLGEK